MACATVFLAYPAEINKGGAKYCSQACYWTGTTTPIPDRFWPKVRRTETCWLWTGATNGHYGKIGVNGHSGSPASAHVIAWTLATEEIVPDGRVIGHTCDDGLCVRNDDIGAYIVRGLTYERRGHLWLATPQANTDDMIDKGRHATGDKHPSSMLTNEQAEEIRHRYAAGGISQDALGREYGVAQVTIYRVLRHRRYAAC